MATIQEILKKARKDQGLSMRKLAEASGVSFSYIQLLESGKRKNITVPIAQKLAGALGVDPAIFFNGDVQVKRPISAILLELAERVKELEDQVKELE
ncbi:MAG: helix-turn-helix domain-containing protein [Dehalococcoidia bacterium]|nr:helix-turn-helix domain-containing protein [Dehalococcoidia bacterium]